MAEPLPLKAKIDHDAKLVFVLAEGEVTLRDMEEHFDRLMVEDAFSYAKLFDAVPVYLEKDMYVLGGRLSAYSKRENGPLAVVAWRDEAVLAAERFLNMSMSSRPAAIFNSIAKAQAWLEERR